MSEPKPSAVRYRLDLRAWKRAGGGPEYVSVTLLDADDEDQVDTRGDCELPSPALVLGESGLTVEDFLERWRAGTPGLDATARVYGNALYRELLQTSDELRLAWQKAVDQARTERRGLRLEIRCPLDSASHWRGQPLSSLPFELMCDERGYLFRRAGWSTVRRSRGMRSRVLRLHADAGERPRVKVAWANVHQFDEGTIDEALFTAHDEAVQHLADAGHVERLLPLPAATRSALSETLESDQPHVLVWVGHGVESGSGLLLHDGESVDYPRKAPGRVVSASDVAATIRVGGVDVALLWSCHGAGTFRSFDVGVAEALLDPDRGDVAAVVASFSALDARAVADLSKNLIASWGHAESDLETALVRARGQLDEASLTWARPVLFLRTPPAAPEAPLVRRRLAVSAPPTALPGRLRWLPVLPPHTAFYVDHHDRLAQLRDDASRHQIVMLEGFAGTGKTELALAFAHELRGQGEDVAFVDLSGQRSLGALLQTLGLLVREQPFDDGDAALFEALRGRRWTLVLDNAEDVLTDDALHSDLLTMLAALRETGPDFRAVVTSRRALAAGGTPSARMLFARELRLLDLDEARRLFVAVAGPRLAPVQAEPDVLDPLLNALGGIARAVLLMAGQLGDGVDVPLLRQRLAQVGAESVAEADLYGETLTPALDKRLSKSSLASALRLSLASAVAQVPLAADLFDALGQLPGGLIQALLPQRQIGGLGNALSALLDHHLVQLVGDNRRIMMAAPVRDWADRRWKLRNGAADGAAELLDGIHQGLAVYADSLADGIGTANALAARLQFLPEASNLVQLIAVRVDAPHTPADDRVAAIAFRCLSRFAEYGGTASAALRILEPLVAKLSARAPGSATAASAQSDIGRLRFGVSDLTSARQAFEQALAIYRQIENRLGEASTLRSLGDLNQRTADLSGARLAYEQALAIYQQVENRIGEANTLQVFGNLKLRTADLSGARLAYEQALSIYRQIENRLGEANTLVALGDLQRRAADLSGARLAYEQALPIYRQIEARLGEANTLRALGDLKLRTADLSDARQAYEQALPIYRQIEDQLGEANTLRALGDLKLRTDDLSGARQAYEQALAIYQQIEDRLGEANTLKALGDLNLCTADRSGARQAYEQALTLYRQIEARLGEANTLQMLGQLALHERLPADAFARVLESLEIQHAIGGRLGVGAAHGYLSRIAITMGAMPTAIGLAARAVAIFVDIDEKFGQHIVLLDLGRALLRVEPERGLACLLEAESLARAIDDPRAEQIADFVHALRSEDVSEIDFEAELNSLRETAPEIVREMFAQAEADVAAGKLDLYTLPPSPNGAADA